MKFHVVIAQFCPAAIGRHMLALFVVVCTVGFASAQKLNFISFDVPAAGTGVF